jgi:hypothetical protein
MKKKLKKFLGASKVVISQQRYQPNKEYSRSLILDSEELPVSGWINSLQQDMPTHSFNKGNAVMINAKSIKSTTSRNLFKNEDSSGSILVEVMPLASVEDAKEWVESACDRVKRTLSGKASLSEFNCIGAIAIPNIDTSSGFHYSMTLEKGLRKSTAVAASVGDVYTIVTCSKFNADWSMNEVVELVQVQAYKIRSASSGLSN